MGALLRKVVHCGLQRSSNPFGQCRVAACPFNPFWWAVMTHGRVTRRISGVGYEALACRALTANEAVTRRWLKRKWRRALRRQLTVRYLVTHSSEEGR